MMTETSLIGIRDPNGSGRCSSASSSTGWVLASETPALDVVGAEIVREIEPGEMVVINADGVRSIQAFPAARSQPDAVLLRVRLLRPPGRHAARRQRARRPPADGRGTGPAGPGRCRRW